jgi:hypothetical protein
VADRRAKLERAALKVLLRRKVRGRYPPEVGFFLFPLFNHLLPNLPDPAQHEGYREHRHYSYQFKRKPHHHNHPL